MNTHIALQKREERYRLLVESVQDFAIFMLDPDGCVATWNSGARRIVATPRRKSSANISLNFTPTTKRRQAGRAGTSIAHAFRAIEDEGWRVRKGGARFWAFAVITAMRDVKGKLIGFAIVTRDLTDRKEADEKFASAKNNFASLVDGVDEYAIFLLVAWEMSRVGISVRKE